MNGRFVGDATRNAHRSLKRRVCQRSGIVTGIGQLVGFLHLRQDLGFAHDHAVQAGRDAEQMTDCFIAFPVEQVSGDFLCPQTVEVCQEFDVHVRTIALLDIGAQFAVLPQVGLKIAGPFMPAE